MDGNARLHRDDRSEHAYPTPTRGLMKTAEREHAKRNPITSGQRTVATPVRHGYRCEDGNIVYYVDPAPVRAEENANKALDARERKQRIQRLVYNMTAEIDHW